MIKHGIALEAKQALISGLHQPTDDFKIALYGAQSKIGPETKIYTKEGEISGKGYVSGGIKLRGYKVGTIGKSAHITFDDLEIKNATLGASGAMIYNASKGNAALCVLKLDGDYNIYNGTFEIKFPKPTETSALILLA